MQWQSCLGLLLSVFLLSLPVPSAAVMGNDSGQSARPNDPDYAAGLEAFDHQDWQGVLDQMTKVIARRPWDDQAHTLMGYATRKLGHYQRSLAHYQQALTLNPYHRGALEYLGETYLAMGCMASAQATLRRLEAACKRIDNDLSRCEEWHDLKTAIAMHQGTVSTLTAQQCPDK